MAVHDAIVSRATTVAKKVDRDAIIRAFVGSLSTRNLPARSAFGSYLVLQKLKAHPFRPSEEFDDESCACCGLPQESDFEETEERVADYPFQVQHTDIEYATYDLETFSDREVDVPTQADVNCLNALLEALRNLPATAQLTELEKSISGAIKSNKHERRILLETFGYAGILCPITKHHYSKRFVTFDEANSDQPKESYKREWEYPVRFWTGKDGVNEQFVKSIFGKLLKK